jgi:hypothetical protein
MTSFDGSGSFDQCDLIPQRRGEYFAARRRLTLRPKRISAHDMGPDILVRLVLTDVAGG